MFKVVIGLSLLVIGIALFLLMYYYSEELRMCGIFLKHASIFIATKCALFLLIPLFMLLAAGLLGLFVFQLLSYWSSADMVFTPK